ncbi:hypothetical protein CK203_040608 [Vitis vinifera]|uniref:Uncharacterized protein n=1 Tax=Vitis vinifera TaxID=29760 RepID=A0A438HI27_VITVI|nr:hypothetical protein CK203_040608 [Vitis vinifera]
MEELEADYQKQVDEMYFFGYRCCMKKHGIKRASLRFSQPVIRMDAVSLTSSAQSKFLPNSAFASSCLPASVRIVGSPISVEMIASIPYARAKGVFLVGRLGVAVIRVLFVASACHYFEDNTMWSMNSGCLVRTEISECDAIKLWTVVGYNGLGDSEAADDVFPYELGDIFVFDASVCFNFHPFTKVIHGDEQKFLLGGCGWEGSHYVHAPLREGPGA